MRLKGLTLVSVFVAALLLTACGGGGGGSGTVSGAMPGNQPGGGSSGDTTTETDLFKKWRAFATDKSTLNLAMREILAHHNRVAQRTTHHTGIEYDSEDGQWRTGGVDPVWRSETLLTVPTDAPLPNTQAAAVLEHNDITVVKYTTRTVEEEIPPHVPGSPVEPERRVYHDESYVGYLEYGSFWNQLSVGCQEPRLNSCDNTPAAELDLDYFTDAYGQLSGQTPNGTGSASWSGMMIGADLSRYRGRDVHHVIGDATVDIHDLANPDVDVSFTGIREVDTGAARPDMVWNDLALRNGTFSDGAAGAATISGGFLGPAEQEVAGVFHRDSIAGSFGAKRSATAPSTGGTSGTRPDPQFSGDWWLPDNTQALLGADSPSVATPQIPQKLVDTGTRPGSLPAVITDGYGRQYDGAFTPVTRSIDYGLLTWTNRAVADIHDVSFAERSRSLTTGSPDVAMHEKHIVGLLDYASFGMWLVENPGGDRLGFQCCEWSVFNDATRPVGRSIKNFSQGTFVWNGAMIGAVKRDPSETIAGAARIELQLNAPATRDPRNMIDVSFTDIRRVNDGSAVSDMSWRLNELSMFRNFGLETVGTGIYGENLVSGSGSIALTWSGPNNANVIGVYDTAEYLGSFGGTKR